MARAQPASGNVIPFRRTPRRTKASRHGGARHQLPAFPLALAALFLATFTAVFLWDAGPPIAGANTPQALVAGSPEWAAAAPDEAELRRRRWPGSAAELDRAQPGASQRLAPGTASSTRAAPDSESARFAPCQGSHRITCVVDGDTFWYRGTKIRIADINTPELHARCPREAQLAAQATGALQAWLNAGPFTLGPSPSGRDNDRYGRALRVVSRSGVSVGDSLVSAGLAERWKGYRSSWC